MLPHFSSFKHAMLDGPSVVAALKSCGVTHAVWLPDSLIGRWDQALASDPDLRLIRVCREAEALAVAGGLLLGGKRPVVLLQCTGLFDAGDALRNLVHDLHLPLFLAVGVRSWLAHRQGTSSDSCPVFTEPFLQAWRIPYTLLSPEATADDLAAAYRRAAGQAAAVLLPE
jgi:sulfopyruvate decarboxylase TPP-binding subunit